MSRSGRRAAPTISASMLKSWGRSAARSRHKAAPTRDRVGRLRSTAVVTVVIIVAVVHGPLMAVLPVAAPFPVASTFPVSPALPITAGLLAAPLFAAPVAAVVVPAVVIVSQQRGWLCIGHTGYPGPGVAGRLQR